MRFAKLLLVSLLYGLVCGCSGGAGLARDSDIEASPSTTPVNWQAIKAQVHEVPSTFRGPVEALGVVLQPVDAKICLAGFLTEGNLQLLMNTLKFKAHALGATGITRVKVALVPWAEKQPTDHRCMFGYMEGSATALILDRAQFPGLYPDGQGQAR